MKHTHFELVCTNSVYPASTTNKQWGYVVPKKGGKTTNSIMPAPKSGRDEEHQHSGLVEE